MDKNRAIIIWKNPKDHSTMDLEIPLDISANDLIHGLNQAFGLNIGVSDVKNRYLKSEHPFALLKGNKPLSEYGLHNGSILFYT